MRRKGLRPLRPLVFAAGGRSRISTTRLCGQSWPLEDKDAAVRLAALADDIDQTVLARIAIKDESADVRRNAAGMLTDPVPLAKLMAEDKDEKVRDVAKVRLEALRRGGYKIPKWAKFRTVPLYSFRPALFLRPKLRAVPFVFPTPCGFFMRAQNYGFCTLLLVELAPFWMLIMTGGA